MSDIVSVRNLENHINAIRICLDNKLILPALVLIYTGMDFAASLRRPEGNDNVTRSDFVCWAEKFMDCRQRLGVSGLDLYGARCGVVHTYSPDSDVHRTGKAKRIMYSWGTKETYDANSRVQECGMPEVFIKIEVLFDEFLHGI
jgi:hypothetical protein